VQKSQYSTLLISASASEIASEVKVEWSKTFGGLDDDEGYSVQQTEDGGYIITGSTESYGAGGEDIWLIKTDSRGNKKWSKTFGGSEWDGSYSVQQTQNGGYILAGSTRSYGADGRNYDVLLIKTDSKGNEKWNKTFGGAYFDWRGSVQQTQDGGYILAGSTSSYGVGESALWLIKTDSKGNEKWNKTFVWGYSDKGRSVQQTQDGGYIITGSTEDFDGWSDVRLIKTDSKGNEEWSKTYGGFMDDRGTFVQQTKDDGYIITGSTLSYGAGSSDIWIIKTDSKGDEEWNKTFGGECADWSGSIQQTKDRGYIIAGSRYRRYVEGYGVYMSPDVWLIKIDLNGNEEWNRIFGKKSYYDVGQSVRQTNDGGYIITGGTKSFGAGEEDVWLIKIIPVSQIEKTSTPEQPTPAPTPSGFVIIFTIIGLLAVAYLLRRRG
jgi:hypothetical protein